MRPSIRKSWVVAIFALLAAFLLPLQALAATSSSDSASSASSASPAVSASSASSASSAASATPSITIGGTEYTKAADGKGSDGGTWSWDGKDALTLDGYSGGGILATGDLDITLSGKNAITSSVTETYPSGHKANYGICVTDGDLALTGDGSLGVDIEDVISAEDFELGIYVHNGDLNIIDTTVDITSSGYGMSVGEGDIDISSSKVTAVRSANATWGSGIIASSTVDGKGNITISDSDVTAEGTSTVGIWASAGTDAQSVPTITIEDSTVIASSDDDAAIVTCGTKQYPGVISITGSTIDSPEGASVLDTNIYDSHSCGQTIGTGTEPLSGLYDDQNLNPAVASSVTITASGSSASASSASSASSAASATPTATSITVDGNTYTEAADGTGSGGGSWSWDGMGTLTLDGYSGGSIETFRESLLTIELIGENTITSDQGDGSDVSGGIFAFGDLIITGDGSLRIEATGSDIANGIWTGSDIILRDTSISVDATAPNGVTCIYTDDGSIYIDNSTVVSSATVTDADGTSIALCAIDNNSSCGNIAIRNSDVTAKASGGDSTGMQAIMANTKEPAASGVIIAFSSVAAEGPSGAIVAYSLDEKTPSTISLMGNTITSPGVACVQDFVDSDTCYGQVVGTTTGALAYLYGTDGSLNSDVATSVTITVPSSSDSAAPTSSATSAASTSSATSAASVSSATSAASATPNITIDGTTYTEAADGTGLGGGTWSWDGAGTLTLDGYIGGSINTTGDLDIDLIGDNTIMSTYRYDTGLNIELDCIDVYKGDLAISGDGTLEVLCDIADLPHGDGYEMEGIYVYCGDVTITKTTVDVSVTGATVDQDSEGEGIYAFNGNVAIVDSTVRSIVDCDMYYASAIAASGTQTGNGNISITGSDVTAKALRTPDGYGIRSGSGFRAQSSPMITIEDSNVIAEGSAGAIQAVGMFEGCPGAIAITDAAIAGSESVHVQDYADAESVGQLISTRDEAVIDPYDEDGNLVPEVVTSVAIWASSSTAKNVTVDGTEYTKASDGAGSGGGTWSWDGAGTLTLDGYSGGSVTADGNLAVDLIGENTITGTYSDDDGTLYGIYSEGSLSLAGDGALGIALTSDSKAKGIEATGSILIAVTDVNVDVDAKESGIGVYAIGYLVIDGSQVAATVASSQTAGGLVTDGGDLDIGDAQVAVECEAEGLVDGACGFGIRAQRGDVNIIDSELSINSTMAADATAEESAQTDVTCVAIDASYFTDCGGNVNIMDSTVEANASGTADIATAISAADGELDVAGSTIAAYAETTDENDDTDFTVAIDVYSPDDADVPCGGRAIIVSSTVLATTADARGYSDGILAADYTSAISPSVIIVDSDITASGSEGAMLAYGMSSDHAGTITVVKSTFVSPDDAAILDMDIDGETVDSYGQVIGTGDSKVTWVSDADGNHNEAIVYDLVMAS